MICVVADCDRRVKARGFCAKHYSQWLRLSSERPKCSVVGCNRRKYRRDLCAMHAWRLKKYGEVGSALPLTNPPFNGTFNGNGRRYVKWNGKFQPAARALYESIKGSIPEGYEVHHINLDQTDDRIENLVALSILEHRRLHAQSKCNS